MDLSTGVDQITANKAILAKASREKTHLCNFKHGFSYKDEAATTTDNKMYISLIKTSKGV